EAQKVRAIALDNWIAQQLHPGKINDDALNLFASRYSALNQDQNDLLRQYAQRQQERRVVKRDRADSTKGMTADDSAMLMQLRQQENSRRQIVTQLQSSRVARARQIPRPARSSFAESGYALLSRQREQCG